MARIERWSEKEMTRRAVWIVTGFFVFILFAIGSLFYLHNKATREYEVMGPDAIYIRWPIQSPSASKYYPTLEFATYFLRITPTGTIVEGVLKEHALPFSAHSSFTRILMHVAVAEKCTALTHRCGEPNETELKELEDLFQEGRRRCKAFTEHIPVSRKTISLDSHQR